MKLKVDSKLTQSWVYQNCTSSARSSTSLDPYYTCAETRETAEKVKLHLRTDSKGLVSVYTVQLNSGSQVWVWYSAAWASESAHTLWTRQERAQVQQGNFENSEGWVRTLSICEGYHSVLLRVIIWVIRCEEPFSSWFITIAEITPQLVSSTNTRSTSASNHTHRQILLLQWVYPGVHTIFVCLPHWLEYRSTCLVVYPIIMMIRRET